MRAARFIACIALFTAGCTNIPRSDAPESPSIVAVPPGFPTEVRSMAADRRFMTSLGAKGSHRGGKDMLRRMREAASDGSLDILALSGGGAGGAFGVGVLVGWTKSGRRPQFEMVTGVSTGALIAPFAFLGPAWDERMTESFSADRLENLLQWRVPGIAGTTSLYKAEPLIQLVDGFVTPELLAAVARESGRGRLLFVATTDLDTEETVIWNLGEIAERGGESARLLFRDVLVASASIPGIFPPVMIRVDDGRRSYDEMHIDGGAITPFFGLPDIPELWSADRNALRGANLYVLVNSQLAAAPTTTPVKPIEILERSFSTTLKHLSRTELDYTADFAGRQGMTFRFTEIPVDYPFPGFLQFGKESLGALFDYARSCASAGAVWMTVDQARVRNQAVAQLPPTERAAACPLTLHQFSPGSASRPSP